MSITNLPRRTNDDISTHVQASLKQRICRGEYVNLAVLWKGAVESADYKNGSSVFVLNGSALESRTRECRDKITSIERWPDAFIIFMDIYLSAQPHRIHEILQYFYTFRECAYIMVVLFGGSMTMSFGLGRRSCRLRGQRLTCTFGWGACHPATRSALRGKGTTHNICLDFNKFLPFWRQVQIWPREFKLQIHAPVICTPS